MTSLATLRSLAADKWFWISSSALVIAGILAYQNRPDPKIPLADLDACLVVSAKAQIIEYRAISAAKAECRDEADSNSFESNPCFSPRQTEKNSSACIDHYTCQLEKLSNLRGSYQSVRREKKIAARMQEEREKDHAHRMKTDKAYRKQVNNSPSEVRPPFSVIRIRAGHPYGYERNAVWHSKFDTAMKEQLMSSDNAEILTQADKCAEAVL